MTRAPRAALALVLFAAACGSGGATKTQGTGTGGSGTSSSSSSASSGSTASSASSSGTGGASPCVAQGAAIQHILDTSKPKAAPGAVLAVITPKCGKWIGATGTSTKTQPMQGSDVMRIGSTTKTFVGARVLQLMEAGKLTLDAPIVPWFPTFPNAAGITIRQLMNHTSGVFNYTDDTGFQMTVNTDPMKKWAHQELVDVAAAQPPYFAPGMGWHYSNTDYIMLGMIVEAVTSDTIGKEIRASVLMPNMLASTSFDGEEPVLGTLAHGWQGTFDVTSAIDPSYAWAAGAMVSSMSDLVDWASALYAGKVLQASTMKQLLTTVPTDQPGLAYGLGVFVGDASIAGDTIIGHPGDIPGYHTHMWYLPNEQMTFATSVNADGADPNDITAALLPFLLALK